MRKITLFILLQAVLLPLSAQTVLTYSSHAMKVGDVVTLKEMNVTTAGEAGANQLWDFSSAEVGQEYVLNYNEDNMIYQGRPVGVAFACTENEIRKPYFQLTATQKLYYGVDGENAQIKFAEPLVDMQYPFAYQDAFGGAMNGTYMTTNNGVTTTIEGKYNVSADAWGTIILPNGEIYENVLRVKSVRDYSHEISEIMYDISVIRYTYYTADSRYAIAQVHDITYTCNCGNGCTSKNITGYFNPQVKREKVKENITEPVIANAEGIYTVYPNPFEEEFTVNYNLNAASKVKITVYDLNGRALKTLVNSKQQQGNYSTTANFSTLKGASVVLLQIQINDEVYTEKLLKKDL